MQAVQSLALGALLTGLASGCAAQRILEVTSVPAGAEVRLDDELVGTTPLELRFYHYGTRRVTLYLDGYRTHSQRVKLKAPWYGRFPWDFFSEVVFPVGWKDRHIVPVELSPEVGVVTEEELAELLERAEVFRRATPEGPRFKNDPAAEPPPPLEPED